ncbi:MAG: VanZ family protein [Candidatus Gastranaerophilales bacterium]|nr:VanZ family protein [Candidatus Gastranaerophilales bacterium]
MLKYILQDLANVFRYLPYGLVAGILVAIVLSVVNDRRVKKERAPFSVAATTGFFMYVVIMLFITFLSRESGSRNGIDLELFSTWGINTRNNAYVVENVLLFVPFGFVCAWALKSARKLPVCTLYGAAGSMLIELMQLVTQRGVFQIDDVLTNTLGTMIGYLLFRCVLNEERTGRQRIRWGVVLLGMILTAAVALFVFGFASEGTHTSDGSDMSVTRYLVQAVQAWLGIDLGRIELAAVLKFFHPLLNKLAHALEYAAICVALGFGFQMIRHKRARIVNYFYALFFCGVIAVLDELLQQYVFKRAGRAVDVLVDIAGAVIGGCIYVFLSEFLEFLTGEENEEMD